MLIQKLSFTPKLTALALIVSSTTFHTASVFADEASADVERIIVTGSRRNDRTVSESTVPVDVINVADMSSTGQLEVSQILTTLIPSFNFPHAAISDGTDHSRPAILRGLAPDHTLVLINGKRRHSSALLNLNGTVGRGSSAVDLNTIPTSAIQRIEVLRDGAAAQYGSDAIAGVINIILKDQEGGNVSITYGQYDTQMAGAAQLTGVSQGSDGDLAFTIGEDRKRSDGGTTTIAADWGTNIGDDGFIHLSFESRDRKGTNRSGFDPREQYGKSGDNVIDPRELTFDRYNHKFGKAEIKDLAFFYNAGWNLSDTTELYSFGSFGEREGLSGGFYRRAIDSRNVVEVYPDGFLPHIASNVKDHAIVVGVKGETNDWIWDASVNYGRNDFNFMVTNSINTSMGAQSPTEFDDGSLIYQQSIANINANKSFDFGLPNDVFVALGAEYRREDYQIKAGDEASYLTKLDSNGKQVAAGGAQVLAGFSPSSATDKSRHNTALFVEFDTNLSDDFNVALATRFEDYSDFGSTLTSKLAARFAITDQFALRGAISSGFRAPSLAQTHYTSIATVFSDGIPSEVGIFPTDHKAAAALGSTQLTAEESINATFGFMYELDNFNLTVDAYTISIDDRIVLSENLSGAAVQAILVAAGELNTQKARYFTNAIDTKTKGIDIVATYDLEIADYGDLRLRAAVNFNDTEVTHVKENPTQLSSLGDDYILFSAREIARFEKGTPKSKYNLAANWQLDDLAVTLRATRYGEVLDASSTVAKNEWLAAKWITDLDINYQVTEAVAVSLGANNLFDQYPQDTISNVGKSTFNQIFPYSGFSAYSTDGRFIYARLSYQF